MIVLAGDVGGTKTHLGLFACADPNAPIVVVHKRRFDSRGHDGLATLCTDFLLEHGTKPDAAAFGIAGPIINGRVETTNLPWVIELASLEKLLSCPVTLLNDLEAMAHGVDELRPDEFLTLNKGVELKEAPRAIIAAGTGLGQGYMVWDAATNRHLPIACEGGHVDFAPRDDDEIDLLRRLLGRFARVSAERVVSGAGIREIFDQLSASGMYRIPQAVRETLACDPAPAISREAMNGGAPVCVEAMRRFVSAYGAEAGNLALKVMARGGLYVGGGIAPKILPLMTDGLFMNSFLAKGRFKPLMSSIPVRILLNEAACLLGAAAVAARTGAH